MYILSLKNTRGKSCSTSAKVVLSYRKTISWLQTSGIQDNFKNIYQKFNPNNASTGLALSSMVRSLYSPRQSGLLVQGWACAN